MSPAYVQVLLHCHAIAEPLRDAPVTQEAVRFFLDVGAIEPEREGFDGSGYTTTEKGCKWVDMICGTPAPEQVWIDPRG